MIKQLVIYTFALFAPLAFAQAPVASAPATAPAAVVEKLSPTVQVAINTNMGKFVLELNRAKAPKTVENFLQYVNDGFYDGTIFHRVIKDFMVQGGGMTPNIQAKITRGPVQNEANNGLSNLRGTVAMARNPDPHSATSQFFINVKDNTSLNYVNPEASWGYCVFGKVVSGMDVIDRIREVQTGPKGHLASDAPISTVEILSAKVVE